MRQFIFILTISTFILSCNQNETKQKELELKERELALKEKEFALKEKDTANLKISPQNEISKPVEANKITKDTVLSSTNKFPFVGTKTFCIVKDVDNASGTFKVTITEDGTISYKVNYKNNGECMDGCPMNYKGKLVGLKTKDKAIIFSNENNFKYSDGEESEFKATLCK